MNRKEYFTSEDGLNVTVSLVLAIPMIILIFGLIFDSAHRSIAKANIEANLSQSLLASVQYTYRAQGSIHPNCAMGSAITEYSQNRLNSRYTAHRVTRATFDEFAKYQKGKLHGAGYASGGARVTGMDARTLQLQSVSGVTGTKPLACSLPSSVPLTDFNKSNYTSTGRIFSTKDKHINVGSDGEVKVKTDNDFFVRGFSVSASKYDSHGKLVEPSTVHMCVTELTPNYFIGTFMSKFRFSPVSACANSSLRLHLL